MLLSLNINVTQTLVEPECTVRNIKWKKQKLHFPPWKTELRKVRVQHTGLKSLLQQQVPLEKKMTRT